MYAFIKSVSKAGFLHRVLTISSAVGAAATVALPSGAHAQTNCDPVPSGVVSWWPLEGNGNDAIGGNAGVISGNTAFVPGEVGLALSCSAAPAGMTVSDSPLLNFGPGADFSIECWVQPLTATTAYGVMDLVDKRQAPNDTSAIGYALDLKYGKLEFEISDSLANPYLLVGAVGPDMRDGLWHHVAVSVQRSVATGGKLYVDGQVTTTFDPTAQQGDLTTTQPLLIGLHPSYPRIDANYRGGIDEIGMYGRALSGAEIAAIYNAGSAGKCTTPTAPFIVTQPASQAVTAGAPATFSVGASGSPPLTYQWQFNSNNIAGATSYSYTIASAQSSDAGLYSVAITNALGFAISSNATLTVNPGPAALRVADANVASGGTVTVPVLLTANGNENALSFSLNFDTNRLTYVGAVLPNGSGAALLLNESQTASGQLGVLLGLQTGQTFPPGAQELVEVSFTAGVVLSPTSTPVTFGDQPVGRQVSDGAGHPLPATYTAGSVAIAAVAYEADVAPRPAGDQNVTATDWVQVGRFVAGLDFPTNAGEFQRADCAPRGTLGDGRISIIDWVQAGRYAARLDPLTPVGGPNAPSPAASAQVRPGGARPLVARQVSVSSTTLNQGSGTVSIVLQAQGDENALGFTMAFDPVKLSYSGATLGSGASGATLNVNTREAGTGRVGFALALGSGAHFAAGADELVKVTFQASVSTNGNASIGFADDPIYREISDPSANVLTADYLGTAITVNPVPSLTISQTDQGITLTWPSWATNYALQQSDGSVNSPAGWTNSSVTVTTTGNQSSATVPIESTSRFYRLLKQ